MNTGTPLRQWVLVLVMGVMAFSASMADVESSRQRMLQAIAGDVHFTRRELGKAALDERVMQAMGTVPRHEFVPEAYRDYAYENRPLPIGSGQTISQPYIVAIMTDLLQLEADDVVFELGTGSGYQAAVLAELVHHVYSMEIIGALGVRARTTLKRLGYTNVTTRVGDGYHGWKEKSPFDAIMVTAAGDHIPPALIEQLKPGGRMMIPVGSRFFTQELILVEKLDNGGIRTRKILPVRFVPITGDH